jgi:POT family proton-dependent oligopeptide transporter
MTTGIVLAGLSWVVVAGLQLWLDRGESVSITWQVLPYVVLTLGEVLVSTTGLEFAYSQAPAQMKGTLMSLWYLAVTVGNLWVLLSNAIVRSPATEVALSGAPVSVTVVQMLAFALFAFVAAGLFGAYARTYPLRDYYRPVY